MKLEYPQTHPEDPSIWSRATCFALAMAALGRAIQIHDGELGPAPHPAIIWLSIAIILTAGAMFVPSLAWINRRVFQIIAALCLLANIIQLVIKPPDRFFPIWNSWLTPVKVQVIIFGLLAMRVLAGRGKSRLIAMAGVIVMFGVLGSSAIRQTPNPDIDVFVFQNDAADAVLHGTDPYAISSRNIYRPDQQFYGDGMVKDGRVLVGYPYPPETLLAILPARALNIDIRYCHLFAILGASVLLMAACPGLPGFAAAMLLLTTPRIFYVLEKSWTEAFTVLGLAASIFTAARKPKWLPAALGLFLGSKQYLPIAVPLFFVGNRPPRETGKILLQAIGLAILVALPLALWNVPAFVHSAVLMQFRQPFRPDSLSFLALMGERFWSRSAITLVPFGSLAAAIVLVLWQGRRCGFAYAVALCLLIFFALSKQAFANYYFFIIAALAGAMAELGSTVDSPASLT
jgi:hypothetical protein